MICIHIKCYRLNGVGIKENIQIDGRECNKMTFTLIFICSVACSFNSSENCIENTQIVSACIFKHIANDTSDTYIGLQC